jgi:hypothetical protein
MAIEHICDLRRLEFAEEIRRDTNGYGRRLGHRRKRDIYGDTG